MSQENGLKRMRMVLVLFSVSYLFYGVSFLFLPGMLSDLSGDPVHLGWIRWAGAPLLALGIGGVQVYRKPGGQDVFLSIATISALLIGCTLLYSKLFDISTKHAWFTLTPCFINLALFVLLLWARKGAKAA